MLKIVTAGATALMLIVGASAYAQQLSDGPGFGRRQQLAPEDRAAFLDARVAGLRAGLRLNAEQEKAWPAFEQAYRGLAATRDNRVFDPRAEESIDPVQRAQRRADALATRSAALKRYADALAPLYQSLDDSQKRRFGFLSRLEERRRVVAFFRGRDRGEFPFPRGEFREFRFRGEAPALP